MLLNFGKKFKFYKFQADFLQFTNFFHEYRAHRKKETFKLAITQKRMPKIENQIFKSTNFNIYFKTQFEFIIYVEVLTLKY